MNLIIFPQIWLIYCCLGYCIRLYFCLYSLCKLFFTLLKTFIVVFFPSSYWHTDPSLLLSLGAQNSGHTHQYSGPHITCSQIFPTCFAFPHPDPGECPPLSSEDCSSTISFVKGTFPATCPTSSVQSSVFSYSMMMLLRVLIRFPKRLVCTCQCPWLAGKRALGG